MKASQKFVSQIDGLTEELNIRTTERLGRVTRVSGMTVEASGISAEIGAQCVIQIEEKKREIDAEVIGSDGSTIYLMPIHFLEGI